MELRYPDYVMKMMNHDQQIEQFLQDLDTLSEAFCEDKKRRKQFFIKKACQLLFTAEQKACLQKVLLEEFGAEKLDVEGEENSGAKTLFRLLSFVFDAI